MLLFQIITSWEIDFNRSMFMVAESPSSSTVSIGQFTNTTNTTIIPTSNTSYSSGNNSNSSSSTSTSSTGLNMPPWAHAAWVTLYTGMLLVAIGGNSIVMWIVIGEYFQLQLLRILSKNMIFEPMIDFFDDGD